MSPPPPSAPTPPPTPRRSLRRWAGWILYLALLAASHSWQAAHPKPRPEPALAVTIPAMGDDGPTARPTPLSFRAWPDEFARAVLPTAVAGSPPALDTDRRGALPIILIHGSPGAADDFDRLAGALVRRGRRVLAPDLPGFGASDPDPPSLSIRAHARGVLAMMDALGLPRAHVVGWSLGGGVALNMADLAPERVASVTLLASVADQASEGSGSFAFEHAKYAAGYAGAAAVQALTPHFGLLRGMDLARASTRNFWDSDMRPLASMMRDLTAPALVLHGRHDFLVPDHAAERAHDLIPGSTLVMLDASHFLPFLQPDESAEHLARFVARTEMDHAAGLPPTRQQADLSPRPAPVLGAPGRTLADLFHGLHWSIQLAALLWLCRRWERLGLSLAAMLVSFAIVDIGVALAAMLGAQAWAFVVAWRAGLARRGGPIAGAGVHTRPVDDWRARLDAHPFWLGLASRLTPGHQDAVAGVAAQVCPGALVRAQVVAAAALSWCLWSLWFMLATLLLAALLLHPVIARAGVLGLLATIPVVVAGVRLPPLLLTGEGRRHLRRSLARARHHEFWPSWTMYVPLAPLYTYLGLRYGPIVFTASNPGIGGGGGVVGESKDAILRALAAPECLPAALVPAGGAPERRAAMAADLVARRADLGGYPVIVKPDSGYRGFALRLVRAPEDFVAYFLDMRNPAIVQRFAPGPHECGVLWARHPEGPRNGRTGFVFSVTAKEFPVLVGDGVRPIEDLILRHARFSLQAGVFLERLAARRGAVLGAGERLRLGEAGNHCQGTIFRDGAGLLSPGLERRIDEIAAGFRGPGGELLDIGRFDIRFESEALLREGRGFAIVELNGNTGESTNIYDPRGRLSWALATQARQWELMYRLGAARAAEGHRPLRVLDLFARLARHYRTRTGSALAD
ncbi:MAG: alpha/beta fold hydrolase [Phycisphaerae bacterium]|nr:alpha/beta fold hydrolase [Phycisphaerae bacterium]